MLYDDGQKRDIPATVEVGYEENGDDLVTGGRHIEHNLGGMQTGGWPGKWPLWIYRTFHDHGRSRLDMRTGKEDHDPVVDGPTSVHLSDYLYSVFNKCLTSDLGKNVSRERHVGAMC